MAAWNPIKTQEIGVMMHKVATVVSKKDLLLGPRDLSLWSHVGICMYELYDTSETLVHVCAVSCKELVDTWY